MRMSDWSSDVCSSDLADKPPTGGEIDMSLSLRMTISRLPACSALFIASYAMPADIAQSPMTAIALPGRSASLFATAKPNAAAIEVDVARKRVVELQSVAVKLERGGLITIQPKNNPQTHP